MANPYNNDEQRIKWNKYVREYSKKNLYTISIKLNKENDKDIIDYLSANGISPTKFLKEAVRAKIKEGK